MMLIAGKPDEAVHALQVNPGGLFHERRDAVEWVRVLAACGVVWFHVPAGPYKEFGHAGLVCFILISVVFQAAATGKETFGAFVRKRARRILPPWLFWFAFYGLFNLVKGKEWFPDSEGILANVLTGTWVGLWYLPFILLVAPVVFLASKAAAAAGGVLKAVLFLAAGLVMLVLSARTLATWSMPEPWGQWIHALPAVALGLAVHASLKLAGWMKITGMALLVAASLAACYMLPPAAGGMAVCYGVAIIATVAGFLPAKPLPRRVTRLGGLCLGVYVMHSGVMTVLKLSPAVKGQPWLLFATTVAVSFIAVAFLRRNHWFARIL